MHLHTLEHEDGRIRITQSDVSSCFSLAFTNAFAHEDHFLASGDIPKKRFLERFAIWLSDTFLESNGNIEGVEVANLFNLDNHTSIYASIQPSDRIFVFSKERKVVTEIRVSQEEKKVWLETAQVNTVRADFKCTEGKVAIFELVQTAVKGGTPSADLK